MERFFNIAGPCLSDRHYMLPALDRLPEVRHLVAAEEYFVIHAPRQTGKTTALNALVDEINAKGEMAALYCSLETLQRATDPVRACEAIQALLLFNARQALPQFFPLPPSDAVREESAAYAPESLAVRETLTSFCRRVGRPFAVFFDEADCLVDDVLLATLGLDEGWLAVFDTDSDKLWDEKIYSRDETFAGKTIHVVGL